MNYINQLKAANETLTEQLKVAADECTRLMAMLEGPKYTTTETTIQAAEISNHIRSLRKGLLI